MTKDLAQEEEWLQQSSVIYGGLIAVGTVMVQPFLTADSLDLSATICVVCFSVAIPLLAALIMVNRQERFLRRMTSSIIVAGTRALAQMLAFAGIVAGFWHISWLAGVGMLVGGLAGVGAHSAGYVRLERDAAQEPAETGKGDAHGDDGR